MCASVMWHGNDDVFCVSDARFHKFENTSAVSQCTSATWPRWSTAEGEECPLCYAQLLNRFECAIGRLIVPTILTVWYSVSVEACKLKPHNGYHGNVKCSLPFGNKWRNLFVTIFSTPDTKFCRIPKDSSTLFEYNRQSNRRDYFS